MWNRKGSKNKEIRVPAIFFLRRRSGKINHDFFFQNVLHMYYRSWSISSEGTKPPAYRVMIAHTKRNWKPAAREIDARKIFASKWGTRKVISVDIIRVRSHASDANFCHEISDRKLFTCSTEKNFADQRRDDCRCGWRWCCSNSIKLLTLPHLALSSRALSLSPLPLPLAHTCARMRKIRKRNKSNGKWCMSDSSWMGARVPRRPFRNVQPHEKCTWITCIMWLLSIKHNWK